jgi:hypothetical protein
MNRMTAIGSMILVLAATPLAGAQDFYTVDGVEPQPLLAQALRLEEALAFLGSRMAEADAERLKALADEAPGARTVEVVQEILDPYSLALVQINPEARVKVIPGPAQAALIQNGWRSFLVKVHNEAGSTAELQVTSPNSEPLLHRSTGAPEPKPENEITPGEVANRFLEIDMYSRRPLKAELSGLELEYAVVQIYTRDAGKREAKIGFNIGQGTQDIGFRNEIDILFDCAPAVQVVFRVKDFDGEPTMASFVIEDAVDRDVSPDYRQSMAVNFPKGSHLFESQSFSGVYPLPARRLAEIDEYPDLYFQPQIYRADGEHVWLPPGDYDVSYTRGPEYVPKSKSIHVPGDGVERTEETFELERWVHMKDLGWYSADHHVHGGGCSHYESPSAGVQPEAMFRQAFGEDLNVAMVLSWGPCWYFQKQFFEGGIHPMSTDETVMRYDVEVSGFPSSHAGHLCLLRLKEDDYPGTTKIEEWPSWTQPVLKWGQEQGGVVGYSHSGWGLEPEEPTEDLPNYVMPKMDGIGANEYIVTVANGACDFISAGDTPLNWELNIWYHTLNCGFRATISGETDFPCIYDERVGMARSYAHFDDGKLDFDQFCQKIKEGGNYVSDGKSHIVDFAVNGTKAGEDDSEVNLTRAGKVTVTAKVSAYLPVEQDDVAKRLQEAKWSTAPYWHIERARIGESRKVPVELVVNSMPYARTEIEADGAFHELEFDHEIKHSSWVALRVLGSSHTNPVYILVDGQPIRASKKSAEWCRAAVDKCWQQKMPRIREEERAEAQAAYDSAREAYDRIIEEAVGD